MVTKQMNKELGEYAARAGPALGTTGLSWFGYPIADIVQVAVLLYTVLQIGWFIYSRLKKVKEDVS
jgi:hypothetical protein